MKSKFPKALPAPPKLHKLIYDMTSEQYHSTPGTYSSSQFKDLLDDEDVFIKKYITKEIEREESGAFDVGNYFHTMVLEPDKVGKDCAVFPGPVKRGQVWEAFKKKHAGKTIVSKNQMDIAERIAEAVQASPVAMSFIERAKPEVSVFVELHIYKGEIYSVKYRKVLGIRGWDDAEDVDFEKVKKFGVAIIVKVRADSLGDDFVLDLKSTTGNARSMTVVQDKIKYYTYDLSASLYLDIFNLVVGGTLSKFIWTFASKDCFNSRSYVATNRMIQVGRAKWKKAVLTLAIVKKNKWEVTDSMGEIEPNFADLHYIAERDIDLL